PEVTRLVLGKVRSQIFHWATDERIERLATGSSLQTGPLADLDVITVTISQKQCLEEFGLPKGASILWTIADDGHALLTVAADQFAKLQGTGDDTAIAFEDADLSGRIWSQLTTQTGLASKQVLKLVGHAGAQGVVREFTRDEMDAMVGKDDLDDYLAE